MKRVLIVDEEQIANISKMLGKGSLEDRVVSLEVFIGQILSGSFDLAILPISSIASSTSQVTTNLPRRSFSHLDPVVLVAGQKAQFDLEQLISLYIAFEAAKQHGIMDSLIELKNLSKIEEISTHDQAFNDLFGHGILYARDKGDKIRNKQLLAALKSFVEFDNNVWTLKLDMITVRWMEIGEYSLLDTLIMLENLVRIERLQNWRFRVLSAYCLSLENRADMEAHLAWFVENELPMLLAAVVSEYYANLACCLFRYDNTLEPPKVAYTYKNYSSKTY